MTLATGSLAVVADSQALILAGMGMPIPVTTRPVKIIGRVSDCSEGHERYAVVPVDPDTGSELPEFEDAATVAELTEHVNEDTPFGDAHVLSWGGQFYPRAVVEAEIETYVTSAVAEGYAELQAELFQITKVIDDGLDPEFLPKDDPGPDIPEFLD